MTSEQQGNLRDQVDADKDRIFEMLRDIARNFLKGRDHDLLNDIVQEVVADIYQYGRNREPAANLAAYCTTAIRNEAVRAMRKRRMAERPSRNWSLRCAGVECTLSA
jgi:DNA-directed RNA polymerase specialized sigma24 family protein